MTVSNPSLVGSVVQAMKVLRHLSGRATPAGVNLIARETGISPSSCFKLLKTLVVEDLLNYDSETKTYSLGLGTVDLARTALARDPVLAACRPAMARIAARYDAAVGLWRLAPDDRLVLVALEESESATRIHMAIGHRQPAVSGATGRTVLASRGADADMVCAALEQTRWQQQPTLSEYCEQIAIARERGWALDIDQIHRGITTIAVSLAGTDGDVRFCISASVFTGRDGPERLAEIGESLLQAVPPLDRSQTL
jgi:DNA-binding IclR family transcriptional regulator